MFIHPKKIVFDTKGDIIDYVSDGLFPPVQSHFDELMHKVRNPDEATDCSLGFKKGKEVVITNKVVSDEEKQILDEVLTRVYGNRVQTRNNILKGIGAAIAATMVYKLFSSNDSKDDNIIGSEYDYIDKDGHRVKYIE